MCQCDHYQGFFFEKDGYIWKKKSLVTLFFFFKLDFKMNLNDPFVLFLVYIVVVEDSGFVFLF